MGMNKFERSLDRIRKNVEIQDCWKEEDVEHYKTIIEALEIASENARTPKERGGEK